jgi:hypothetical protein
MEADFGSHRSRFYHFPPVSQVSQVIWCLPIESVHDYAEPILQPGRLTWFGRDGERLGWVTSDGQYGDFRLSQMKGVDSGRRRKGFRRECEKRSG